MHYAKYKFTCNLVRQTLLPYYKGAVFRNLFGRHLKRAACFYKSARCDTCRQTVNCIYSLFFEMPAAVVKAGRFPLSSPPRPFIFEPPSTLEIDFPAGAPFDFQIVLFGKALEAVDCFIRAVEAMGRAGIGRPRSPLDIKSVTSGDQMVYRQGRFSPEGKLKPESLLAPASPQPGPQEMAVKIAFTTPLRLKTGETPGPFLSFQTLVRMMLRRVSTMFACYGEGEPEMDYKGLIEQAKRVAIAADKLRRLNRETAGVRQEKVLLQGGLTGSVVYKGHLTPFLPLIHLSEQLHVGRQTAFGLGRFVSEILT